ncbi:hypothetical protein [Candidatus Chrysopegis kryptomonas]|jgi:hypothetical protein|uniref:Lipoprotein n=1 Tax=Candidatus Chryseopegocella kryptomonas TaxID=1633643 RepID=A0A0N7MXV3_9BACT|nr:hypothetical protein [Candidatus Chrysopegis kryptomonas]CUT02483.1 hypothetical protein JGI23_01267 [Candidatus Chrysopegis kryptomonas]
MKGGLIFLAIFVILFSSGCAINGILLNPLPSPVYHKDATLISAGASFPVYSAEAQIWGSKKDDLDIGLMIGQYIRNKKDEDHFNLSGFVRKWIKSSGAENPWANVYGGIQASSNWDLDYGDYSSGHFEFGVAPGFYRKRFNFAFVLRGGAGFAFPYEPTKYGFSYGFSSAGMQIVALPFNNFGLGIEGNYGLGAGEMKGARIVVIPPLFRVFLFYRK